MLDRSCLSMPNMSTRQVSAVQHPARHGCKLRKMQVRARAAEFNGNGPSPHEIAKSIVQAAVQGTISVEEAASAMSAYTNTSTHQEKTVSSLKAHKAFPEVVWGSGKSAEQTAAHLQALSQTQRVTLALKIEPETYAAVRKLAPGVKYNMASRTLSYSTEESLLLPKQPRMAGSVALLVSSSADEVVAGEFKAVAEAMGCYVFKVAGAAGFNGLLQNLEGIQAADVVVVVTGVDAGLPATVAELVDSPVVAIPTSAWGQHASTPPALGACPGIHSVDTNNGYSAAMFTARILKSAGKLHQLRSAAEAKAAAQNAASVAEATLEKLSRNGAIASGSSANGANGFPNHDLPLNGYFMNGANGAKNGFTHPEVNADSYSSMDLETAIMDQLQKSMGANGNGNGNGNRLYVNGNGNGNGNGVHVNGNSKVHHM